MTNTNQAEIEVYRSEASVLENQANDFQITSPIENSKAMEFKAALKAKLKVVTQAKEKVTKPLNEALKNTREMFAPIERQITSAEDMMGNKLLAYKRDTEAAAKIEADKIAKKVETGRMRLDTAEKKMDAIEEKKVEKTTHTNFGAVQFRKIKKVRFADLTDSACKITIKELQELLKAGYITWDAVKTRQAALATQRIGEVMPGVEVYEEETV